MMDALNLSEKALFITQTVNLLNNLTGVKK